MTIRFLAAAALLATLSSPALAQADAPAAASQPAAPAAARPELVPVAIETSLGRIVVALDKTDAPVTTANFLRYVDAHRFDGEAFYRAMRVGSGGLIQGGISSDARKLYPPIAHEPTTKTGLHDVAGAIAMANAGAGTARADFFILASDMPSLDATADQPGFAVFGHVIEGMDVVQKILAAPVSETKGEGVMKGQMLDPTIKIVRMSRLAPSKP
ncbi:MAG TPA: peptidylprolyl isomerase [Sphingomicrobium sp.]|nr:peptidylprolyl isomerase [Sphingomicrobium sp.]